MGGGQLVVVGMLLSTSRAGELVTCRPGHVPSKVGVVVGEGCQCEGYLGSFKEPE